MAHVHRLGDIGAAIVHEDATRGGDARRTGSRIGGNRVGPSGQGGVGDLQIDEPRPGDLHAGEARVAGQPGGHGGGDLTRIATDALGGGQSAVGLEIGQVGPVGSGDPGQIGRQAFGGEGGRDRFA